MNDEIECSLSTIDSMAAGPIIQRQILAASYVPIKPSTTVKGAQQIEFIISSKDDFFDLAQTELEVKFRVKKSDGTNLVAGDKVSVINYPIASLFENIVVSLNGEEVSHSGANYAVRAYLETLLSYGTNASKSWLQAGLFHKDTPDQMDNADPAPAADAAVNTGLKERAVFTNLSGLVVVRGKLHLDLFHQSKPLVSNVDLRLRFHRNKDAYCLMSSTAQANFKIDIEDMTLFARRQTVSAEVHASVSNGVNYPITRVVMKDYHFPAEGKSISIDQFHRGTLPSKIIFAFANGDATVGNYARNPFNFKNYDLSQISLKVNGQVLDGEAQKYDFGNNQYTDGYWGLFRATNKKYRDEGMLFELKDFKRGYAVYAFDLTASLCDDQYRDQKRNGTIELEFTFENNIPEVISLCAYLQFESEIVINEAGRVTTLFA